MRKVLETLFRMLNQSPMSSVAPAFNKSFSISPRPFSLASKTALVSFVYKDTIQQILVDLLSGNLYERLPKNN